MQKIGRRLVPTLLLCLGCCAAAEASPKPTVRLGVWAYRGPEFSVRQWRATAAYLSARVPGHEFVIVPLALDRIHDAVGGSSVDFMLMNPASYVDVEVNFGVARIATMQNRYREISTDAYGGTIFCRKDRADIAAMQDVKGKRFAAVEPSSFGGWLAGWREFKALGIEPKKDFVSLTFMDIQDNVVRAVLEGRADAGIVRTGVLEDMAHEGRISLSDLRVLNPRQEPGFPYLLSTPLYPEWVFAKAAHTPVELSKRVAVALLTMPAENAAARTAGIAGWTIPRDYQPVHEVLKELRVRPYEDFGRVTLAQAVAQYRSWIVAIALALLLSILLSVWLSVLARRLTLSRNEISQILDTATEGLRVISTGHDVLSAGRNFHKVAGVSPRETVGKKCHEVLPGPNCRTPQCPLQRILSGESRVSVEERRVRPDGNVVICDVTATALRDGRGRLIGIVEDIRDLTERRKMQDAMLQSEKMSAIGQMAAGLAHEIVSPLTVIFGFAKMADEFIKQGKPLDEPLTSIRQAATTCKALVQNLLTFSRASAGDSFDLLDVNRSVEAALNLIETKAKTRRIKIARDLGPSLPSIRGNSVQIQQIVVNLCDNAMDAMAPAGGTLTVRTAPEGGSIRLDITDTGTGIPEDIQKKIFEPFYTTKEPGKGTGLGLALVKDIVNRHKGRIALESRPGAGTTFSIVLPGFPGFPQAPTAS